MARIAAIGTYLPPWEKGGRRVKGPDEDALTMAVAAGRVADPGASARRLVMVSRNFPLLEGGNGAVLLAALSLPADVPVAEVLGGEPADRRLRREPQVGSCRGHRASQHHRGGADARRHSAAHYPRRGSGERDT